MITYEQQERIAAAEICRGMNGVSIATRLLLLDEGEPAGMPTRSHLIGQLVNAALRLYQVDTVLEKPTPTEAEQKIDVPGLRSGYYLGFFGMHVLTPAVQRILGGLFAAAEGVWQ